MVNFKRNINITSCVPLRKTKNSVGCDLYATENKIIKPCTNDLIHLELYIAIPKGFYGIMVGRSSLVLKKIIVHNGVIDSDYHGIIFVILCTIKRFFCKEK